MADNDLELHLRATADLSALKQAQTAVEGLAATTQKVNWSQVRSDTERFQKAMASHAGDTSAAGYQGLTGAAAAMERLGVNVARTRNEFTTLVREMAAGAPISRTLGALLGALGFKLVGAAAAIVGPFLIAGKAAKETADQVSKIDESVGKQVEDLDKAAEKWEEIARNATTTKDVAKLAAEGAEIFRNTSDKTRQIQAEQLGVISKMVDALVNVNPARRLFSGNQDWTPFANSLKAAQAEQQKMMENTEEEVSHIIDVAKRSAAAWENLYAEPTGESIKELSAKIVAYKGYLDSIDTKPGPGFDARMQDYKITSQRVAEFAAQLKAVINLQAQELSIGTNLSGSEEKRYQRLKAITSELQKIGITAGSSQGIFEQAKNIPGPGGERGRELAGEMAKIEKQGLDQLVSDMKKDPFQEQRDEVTRKREHIIETQARRALGQTESPQEEQRFQLEEERRELLRAQALSMSLIPPGFEETPSVYLGKQGAEKFRARAGRLKTLDQLLGESPLSELGRQPLTKPGGQAQQPGGDLSETNRILTNIYTQWQ